MTWDTTAIVAYQFITSLNVCIQCIPIHMFFFTNLREVSLSHQTSNAFNTLKVNKCTMSFLVIIWRYVPWTGFPSPKMGKSRHTHLVCFVITQTTPRKLGPVESTSKVELSGRRKEKLHFWGFSEAVSRRLEMSIFFVLF